MRTGNVCHEEDDPSSCNQTSGNKDGKNMDKAAIRSKHSVTEQRRRSKINERFQRLRDLIPNPDQKRDTASFLLEVIEYVQYLQEKVKKYEDSYHGWSSEPMKLMPWRNSHWRVQNFVGQPQAFKNSSVMMSSAQHAVDADAIRDATSNTIDRQPELANKGMPLPIEGDNVLVQHPLQRPVPETQSTEYLINDDMLNTQEDLTIKGGTISVSSVYSHGLLNTLAQALQGTGLDLSQANISVQIDLGKHANVSAKAMTHLRDVSSGEDSDHAQKRLKK